jgi:probable rRNA maturation factor
LLAKGILLEVLYSFIHGTTSLNSTVTATLREHLMQEHPLIELYVNQSTEQETTQIEQYISTIDLDSVVLRTLQITGVTQPVMLTLLITDDEGIREMNKQYREQDKATDVLSFPLIPEPIIDAPADQLWSPQIDENAVGGNPDFITPPGMITNLGDIVISWPTILRQAQAAGHNDQTELIYLLSHGVLHLIGYDDQTEAGYQAMVGIQQTVLQGMGQATYREQ